MKKRILSFSAALLGTALVVSSYSNGPAGNGLNRTGSAGSSPTCTGAGCHSGTANGKAQVGFILQDPANTSAIITKYVPGKQYNVILSGSYTGGGHPKFGFQMSSVKKSATSVQLGSFSSNNTAQINTATVGGVQIIEHKQALPESVGVPGTNIYSATFKWTAPATGTDTARFFAILNAVDGDGVGINDTADHYGVSTFNFPAQPVGVNDLQGGLSGRMYPNPVSNNATITLRLGEGAEVTARIFSLNGSSWLTEHYSAAAGSASHSLVLGSLPAGQYLLSVQTSKGGSQVIPFTKL